MPLRTSTVSSVMRKVCMRQDSQNPTTNSRMPTSTDTQHERHEALGDEEVDRVALVAGRADHEVEQPLAQVRDDDARDRDQRDAAAQQRGRRMQSVPLAVGERRARRHRRSLDRIGHSPARRVSASATSWSRSCSASSNWQTRDRHVRRRGGRHELQVGEADGARQRAARDVDQLHPSVGHRDEALEHDAAAEQQVVVAQAVADRADPARGERHRHDRDDRRGGGQQQPEGSRMRNHGIPRATNITMPPTRLPSRSTTTYLGETRNHSPGSGSSRPGVLIGRGRSPC